MAERSNIFVRIRAKKKSSNKKYQMETFFGLYYDWCHGERMISRLRSAIDFANKHISGWHGEYVVSKDQIDLFKQYLAVNFDMRDITTAVDLFDALRNDVIRGDATEKADIFDQAEDHGFIYIDITLDDPENKFGENNAKIKYAFVDNEYKNNDGSVSPVRNVENFADHDIGNGVRKWYEPDPYWDERQMFGYKKRFLNDIVPTTKKNIETINKSATLMTEDDRKDFVKFVRAYTRKKLVEVENKKLEIRRKRNELFDCLNNLARKSGADDTNYIKLMHLISATFPRK